MSLPGASGGLNIYQAAQLVSASSRQLFCSESLQLGVLSSEWDSNILFTLAEGLMSLVCFRDFLNLFCIVYFPCLRSFPAGWNILISEKTLNSESKWSCL